MYEYTNYQPLSPAHYALFGSDRIQQNKNFPQKTLLNLGVP